MNFFAAIAEAIRSAVAYVKGEAKKEDDGKKAANRAEAEKEITEAEAAERARQEKMS